MTTVFRIRWLLLFIGLAVGVTIAAVVISGPRGPKTWTIQLHEQLTIPANEVHPDDLYRCEGMGAVDGTPDIGTAEASGSLYVGHNVRGHVSMSCERGVDWAFT